MTPTGFESWKQYFSCSLAREFRYADGRLFESQPNRYERLGRTLSYIVMRPLDLLAREIRNPLVLLALTVTSLFFTSIAFYPLQTWTVVSTVLPFIKYITAAHVQGAFYAISQSIILGLGLQAFGRFSNRELMAAFRNREIQPIPIGAIL